jgi:hypothetical protein
MKLTTDVQLLEMFSYMKVLLLDNGTLRAET